MQSCAFIRRGKEDSHEARLFTTNEAMDIFISLLRAPQAVGKGYGRDAKSNGLAILPR